MIDNCEDLWSFRRILIPFGFGSGILPVLSLSPSFNHSCDFSLNSEDFPHPPETSFLENISDQNANLSATNLTSPELEVNPQVLNFSILVVVYSLLVLITVIGNIFVIVAFLKDTSLQAVTNFWVISLSLTDIILATTVMPIGIVVELSKGIWLLGRECCRLYITLDVLCCTCSIYHLALISLDRYFCVRYPFTYPQQRTKSSALLAILITWILCLLISLPPLLGWEDLNELDLDCRMTSKAYMITSSILSFYFPLLLIICMYVGIYRATNRHHSKLLGSGRTPNSPAHAPNSADKNDKQPADSYAVLNRDLSNERSVAVRNGLKTTTGLEEFHLSTIQPRLKTIREAQANNRQATRFLSQIVNSPVINTLKTRLRRPSKSSSNEVPMGPIRHSIPTVAASANLIPLLQMSARNRLLSVPLTIGLNPEFLGEEESHYEMSKSIPHGTISSASGDENANTLKSESPVDAVCSPPQPLHRSKSNGSEGSTTSSELRLTKTLAKLPGLRLKPGAKPTQNTSTRFHRTRLKQERRAARIVVMILAVFILFWTPFFVVNIVAGSCEFCHISQEIWKLVIWTGYANSAINPFIYTCFNRNFRRSIRTILRIR